MHLVSRGDQSTCMTTLVQSTCMNTLVQFLCMTYLTTHRFKLVNFFFLSFLYARVLVSQFLFFFHYCFSPLHIIICTTQPGFESSLENTFSWFFDLFLVLGVILHNYFQNDHSKSKVLGYMTAQHLILISTSGFKFIVYLYVFLWVLSISFSFFFVLQTAPSSAPSSALSHHPKYGVHCNSNHMLNAGTKRHFKMINFIKGHTMWGMFSRLTSWRIYASLVVEGGRYGGWAGLLPLI